jgi:PAS domain S-box-containing protein
MIGNIPYLGGMGINIAERKKIEEELKKKKNSLDNAQRIANIGNWDWDIVKNELYWSDEIYRIFGLNSLEFGATYEAFVNTIHPDDRELVQISVDEALHDNKPYSIDHRIILPNGSIRIVHEQAEVNFDETGKPLKMIGTVQDITDRKKVEEELKATLKDLKRSNTELEQFAYVASHDLQEPLRMVASFTQLLQNRYQDKLDEDANDFINYAVDGATRMHFRQLIKETNATLTYNSLPMILADGSQMIELLQNLISNAIKFHKEEEPPVVHISAKLHKNQWIFSIRDNGIGIDSQYFDRIFIIFQHLHKKSEYEGTGIGLAICKKIIERHKGKIWVESELGKGSTFYFSIPKTEVKN